MLTYASIGIGLLMAVLYFGIIFRDIDGFKENLAEDGVAWQANPRLLFWIMISVGCGILAFYQLPEWFPHVFGK